jgi:hypothetical protein
VLRTARDSCFCKDFKRSGQHSHAVWIGVLSVPWRQTNSILALFSDAGLRQCKPASAVGLVSVCARAMRASTSQAEAVIGVYDQKYRAYEYKPESRFRFAVRGQLFDGKCPG